MAIQFQTKVIRQIILLAKRKRYNSQLDFNDRYYIHG